jgi:hypothetical protein
VHDHSSGLTYESPMVPSCIRSYRFCKVAAVPLPSCPLRTVDSGIIALISELTLDENQRPAFLKSDSARPRVLPSKRYIALTRYYRGMHH